MEIINNFEGKEDNNNRLAEVGETVTIKDEKLQEMVAKHLDQDEFKVARVEGDIAYLIAATDYKVGMYIPIRPLEMTGNEAPSWGVDRKNLKIKLVPRIVAGE